MAEEVGSDPVRGRSAPAAVGSVNRAEVARFDALAETWWDPDGTMWPLHRLNALRVPYILSTVQRCMAAGPGVVGRGPLGGLTVLDVGCAAGLLSEALARAGARVTGIDPSGRNIAIARAHSACAGLHIDYRQQSVEALSWQSFDVVLNMEVVEHVERLPEFMARCCSLVRPGGMQFVSTINRTPWSFLAAIVGAEYVMRWLPRGTHRWRKFVKPAEIREMLAAGGMTVVDQRGVKVSPLTRRFRLSKSTAVNYLIAARRPT